MAFCTLTLHQVMKGTDSEPPPIATSDEIAPITLPTPISPAVPATAGGLGFDVEDHLHRHIGGEAGEEDRQGLVGAWDATKVPAKVPASTPGAMPLTMSQRTAPWAWWARRLEIEVTTMPAIEVPRARCTMCSFGNPGRRTAW